jgi:nitric oxide reductase NorD protein
VTIAQISSLDSIRSGRRLAALLRGHDDLGSGVQAARASLQRRPEWINRLAVWDDVVHHLFEANLGEAVVLSFLRLSEQWPQQRTAEDLTAIGCAVREIGCGAGSRVAHALLAELPKVLPGLATADELITVLAALRQLVGAAPESVGLVVGRLEQLLLHAGADDFSAWVSGGLRAAGGRAARRRAYFALDDALSRRLFARNRAGDDFARMEKRLGSTMLALWNKKPLFRKLSIQTMPPVPRRTSLVGGLIGWPETFPGLDGGRADAIYLAASAHAGAHFAHSSVRFPVGRLKPLQLALISLVEDARVEALAMRNMPGLRRLWMPFHTATPSPQATVAGLMMRLSRALIDPNYDDPDAWVGKGRALFAAAADRRSDPASSREIGGLLGNDIGQMRLQFNAKSYVVEPAYRDDNLALWDFGDQPDGLTEEIELAVDSVRIERRNAGGAASDDTARPDETQRARASRVTMLDGFPVATYPEWDYAARIERPDWATVLEADAAASANPDVFRTDDDATRRVTTLTRDASIGRRVRYKGQRDGDAVDIDAAIALTIERRAGRVAEPRIYLRDAPGPRDLVILLLLDLSQSTSDRDRQGRSVLEVERKAAAIMTAAVEAADDAIAVHGFNSEGRERVRYVHIKGFDERMDAVVRSRLAGLTSSHSTRLGPALRHAGSYLSQRRAFRKVLLVLTDGEPSDVDVPDQEYLAEDARRAVQQLRRRGIDTFAFGIGNGPFSQLDRIFGERRALRVPRIEVLPQRVVQLYAELKK